MAEEQARVFVLGPSRSGTTLMDLLLGHGAGGFSMGEVYGRFRPIQERQKSLDCSCGGGAGCPWAEGLWSDASEQDVHGRAARLAPAGHVSDSSKRIDWVIDRHNDAPSASRFVVMVKHPREIIDSHVKRGNDPETAIRAWLTHYEMMFTVRLPFVAVYLSDLRADPVSTLEVLADLLGTPPVTRLDATAADAHLLFGSKTLRATGPLDRETVPLEFSPASAAGLPYGRRVARTIEKLERRMLVHRPAVATDERIDVPRVDLLQRYAASLTRANERKWRQWRVLHAGLTAAGLPGRVRGSRR